MSGTCHILTLFVPSPDSDKPLIPSPKCQISIPPRVQRNCISSGQDCGTPSSAMSGEKVGLALSKLQSMCDTVSHSGTIHPPEEVDGLRGRVERWCLAGQIPRPALAIGLDDSVRLAGLQPIGHCVAPKYRKAGARLTCMNTVSHLHGSCES
ncbi:hypothetical protein KVR01_010010 [Diaporthe batatas]|uniref:uncharacterized protein n=1 Tax=Diaporthe batatas TaxID=748121 RepID=UPI001D045473|nr:uncharacterized protein KVR01_010010 [Diaporthe batatas]KAG8160474.1 hypothetical protein KVR01_010010 [Diaporthe batatas]